MRVFLTGATGFIGSRIIPELLGAGHQVLGMARSDAGAESLRAAGAAVHQGSLEDVESLRSGAAQTDATMHLAFNHDFSRYADTCELDRRAIEALGTTLRGTKRRLVVTSGTALVNTVPGRVATEEDVVDPNHPLPRVKGELAAAALAAEGVNVSIVRLPQVHDTTKQGLVTMVAALAREKGVSAYVGDGSNRWTAAPVADVAHLYRLVLEKGEAGARYHAVAEEGVPMRDIAEALGEALQVPVRRLASEEAADHFGWLSMFMARDLPASSALTRERLGWQPTGRGLLADLREMRA